MTDRDNVLLEACKAICRYCAEELPVRRIEAAPKLGLYHEFPSGKGYVTSCQATKIRELMTLECEQKGE